MYSGFKIDGKAVSLAEIKSCFFKKQQSLEDEISEIEDDNELIDSNLNQLDKIESSLTDIDDESENDDTISAIDQLLEQTEELNDVTDENPSDTTIEQQTDSEGKSEDDSSGETESESEEKLEEDSEENSDSEVTLFGLKFTNLKYTSAVENDGKYSISADAAEFSGDLSAKQIVGEYGDGALEIVSGTLEYSGENSGFVSFDKLSGAINKLNISKQGIFFEGITVTGNNVKVENIATIESISATLGRSSEKGLSLTAEFEKLTLGSNLSNDYFALEAKEIGGSLLLSKEKKEFSINEDGCITAKYKDILSFSMSGLAFRESKISATAVTLSTSENSELSLLGGLAKLNGIDSKITQMSIDKNGVSLDEASSWGISVKKFSLFDKELGSLDINIDKSGLDAKLLSPLSGFEINLSNNVGVSLNGSVGLKIDESGAALNFGETSAKIKIDSFEMTAGKFSSGEDGTLKIGSIGGAISFDSLTDDSGNVAAFIVSGSNFNITKDKNVQFESLTAKLEKSIKIGSILTIGNPTINILNNFEDYQFGGKLSVASKYIKGETEILTMLDKENGYDLKLVDLQNFAVSIPGLAKFTAKKITPSKDPNDNRLDMENLSFAGDFNPETFKEEDGIFYKLLSSTKDISINLQKASIVNDEIIYDKKDFSFGKDEYSVSFFKNKIKATLNVKTKKLSFVYNCKIPEEQEGDSFPEQFSVDLDYPIPPCLMVGGGFGAGAGIEAEIMGALTLNSEEKSLVLTAGINVKKAIAGVSMNAHIGVGVVPIGSVKFGIRGSLIGSADGKSEANVGLTVDDKDDIVFDKTKTNFNLNLNAKLSAKLDAFVRGKLLFIKERDLFAYTIVSGNLISAELGLSGSYDDNGKWGIIKEKSNISSDFVKDIFDPNSPDSVINQTEQKAAQLNTISDFIKKQEVVFGAQDFGESNALEKIACLQKDIFPKLSEIKNLSDKTYESLYSVDKKSAKAIIAAKQAIAKHQKRIFEGNLANEIDAEDKSKLTNLIESVGGRKTDKGSVGDATQIDLQRISELEPVKVITMLSKIYGDKLQKLPSKKEYTNMMDEFIGIRKTIKQIASSPISATEKSMPATAKVADVSKNSEKDYNASVSGFNKFRNGKDTTLDKLLAQNKTSLKNLQTLNIKLLKTEEKSELLTTKLGNNFEKLKLLQKMNAEYDALSIFNSKARTAKKAKIEAFKATNKLTNDDSKNFEEYNETEKQKSKLREEVKAAKAAVNLETQTKISQELKSQNLMFIANRAAVRESRESYIASQSKSTVKKSDYQDYLTDVAAIEQDSLFNCEPLFNIYGNLINSNLKPKNTKNPVDSENFNRLSKAAIDKSNSNNSAVYLRIIMNSEKAKGTENSAAEDTPEKEISQDFAKSLFSSASMNGVRKARKQKKEGDYNRDISISDLTDYSQGRIDFYQGKIKLIEDTISNIENVITKSNDQYIVANDMFVKLNGISAENFNVKTSYGDKGSDSIGDTSTYKEAINSLCEADSAMSGNGDFTEKNLNKLEQNVADKATNSLALIEDTVDSLRSAKTRGETA